MSARLIRCYQKGERSGEEKNQRKMRKGAAVKVGKSRIRSSLVPALEERQWQLETRGAKTRKKN
jgi:hypothetical protein